MTSAALRSRKRGALLLAAIIASGLLLRGFGPSLGLPFLVVKYSGSLLWGMMVYVALTIIIPCRGRACVAAVAFMIAAAVELSRLYHTPWLDAFRLTTAGALLLGRVFSPWNLAAYGVGILLGCIARSVTRARLASRRALMRGRAAPENVWSQVTSQCQELARFSRQAPIADIPIPVPFRARSLVGEKLGRRDVLSLKSSNKNNNL